MFRNSSLHHVKVLPNLLKQRNILKYIDSIPHKTDTASKWLNQAEYVLPQRRPFSYSSYHNAKHEHELSENVKASEGAVTVGQKVKQAGKDASYLGILLVGFGVTGALVWYVARELVFGFSPNSVYSKALKIVKGHHMANEEVGNGMKGYGEETARGRRRHVSFQEYVVDGVNHMRIQFYVSGSKRKATVHAEAREVSRGSFEFRYIFLELQGYPPSDPVVILDNR